MLGGAVGGDREMQGGRVLARAEPVCLWGPIMFAVPGMLHVEMSGWWVGFWSPGESDVEWSHQPIC